MDDETLKTSQVNTEYAQSEADRSKLEGALRSATVRINDTYLPEQRIVTTEAILSCYQHREGRSYFYAKKRRDDKYLCLFHGWTNHPTPLCTVVNQMKDANNPYTIVDVPKSS